MQQAQYFMNEGEQLAGTVHLPGGADPFPAVVLCHGFTGQRMESHLLFVKMSRALEEAGIASLRFDFRGSGESDGRFQDMTVEGEVSDALKAFETVLAMPEIDEKRVGVLGLSLGGCVAACVTGFETRAKSTALWSAVADLPETIGQRLTEEAKQALVADGFLDFDGHAVGRRFFDTMKALDPLQLVAKSSNPLLIVHGSGDETVPVEHADRYQQAATHGSRQVEKLIVDGADHTFTSLRWEAEVIERTVKWFAETL
jgi:dipeptidyl aminopeptidase/acylaminoacyl peptidase